MLKRSSRFAGSQHSLRVLDGLRPDSGSAAAGAGGLRERAASGLILARLAEARFRRIVGSRARF